MATGNLVSVREYLTTSYRPDCDYVDGVIMERNLGERDHSKLQMVLSAYFYNRRQEWGLHVFPEQRVQVSPTRFRIPHICVVLGDEPDEQIFTKPPFICIEILSKEDRIAAMERRVQDFVAFGVPYVWILDPRERKAWQYTPGSKQEVKELRTANPVIAIPLAGIFE